MRKNQPKKAFVNTFQMNSFEKCYTPKKAEKILKFPVINL